jgi:hypothetical protein
MRAESRLDGGTLVVRIPMRLGKQRGRKRILAPDGSELTPPTKPQPDGVLVKALTRAWRWQKLLDRGVYGSVTEIAEAEKISKSYVSRVLRLALLAPDLVEAILRGLADERVMLEQFERPLPGVGDGRRRALLHGRSIRLAVRGRLAWRRRDKLRRRRPHRLEPGYRRASKNAARGTAYPHR